jgi:hypothetical protein
VTPGLARAPVARLAFALASAALAGCTVGYDPVPLDAGATPDAPATLCAPGARGCAGPHPGVCRADGSGFDPSGSCDLLRGQACDQGICESLCDIAVRNRSYQGCEFRALDLDNGNEGLRLAAAQQYAVIVSNPSTLDATVRIEHDVAALGAPPEVVELARRTIPPGGLEVFELEPRSLDGASDSALNDGTHSAITSLAYRVVSDFPVVAYQFNPLEPIGTYTEDASLLLPTSAWGTRYTVVTWPQTIGPQYPATEIRGTQWRSSLTIAAASADTHVTVRLGEAVIAIAAAPGIPRSGPGDVIEVDLGPFDVLNLETSSIGADFSGTVVEASADVAVFVGTEGANVPFRLLGDVVETFQAADHLEEQLLPDRAHGTTFVLARLPSRTRALSESFAPGRAHPGVLPTEEADVVRMINTGERDAVVTTSLPAPHDRFVLPPRGLHELLLAEETLLSSDQPLSVIQLRTGQEFVSIPSDLPGGDPDMIIVPSVDQLRLDYVFLVPEHHAFDFVTIVAPRGAGATLDGDAVEDRCAAGIEVPESPWLVHHCALSDPLVYASPAHVDPGVQDDGAHTVRAAQPVAVFVSGFDTYKGYAYPAGMNLTTLR